MNCRGTVNVCHRIHYGGRDMSSKQAQSPAADELTQIEPSDTGLERDEIFEILSNQRRRYILHYLKQQQAGHEADLREIVDQVAAWENNTSIQELDSTRRKRVYTAVRQSHLPKLDDTGVVDYDQQRGEVVLTDAARDVEVYLEYVPEEDISWGEYYLALSGICFGIAGAAFIDAPVFGSLSGVTLAGVIVTVMTVSSVAHVYYSRTHRIGRDGPPTDQYP